MDEFVVWGIPPNKTGKFADYEEPLFTKAKTLTEAKNVARLLAEKHGCTKTRVQVIDFNEDLAEMWRRVVR